MRIPVKKKKRVVLLLNLGSLRTLLVVGEVKLHEDWPSGTIRTAADANRGGKWQWQRGIKYARQNEAF